jgi:hypothetical protein
MKTKMKTNQILMIIGFTGLLFLGACGSKSQKGTNQTEDVSTEHVYYTCEMHPEVQSDKPGNCPKCGMELIKAKRSDTDTSLIAQ